MTGSIVWDASAGNVSLDEWLAVVKPSQISKDICQWISVRNPDRSSHPTRTAMSTSFQDHKHALDKLSLIKQQRKRIPAAVKKECMDTMVQTATTCGDTTGKWLTFPFVHKADDVWDKIARATVAGKLGYAAKIAPAAGENKSTVCCIYLCDFNCRNEVKRVLKELMEMKVCVTGFKPDFFTTLGIDSKNEWNLEPCLYSVKEVLEWP